MVIMILIMVNYKKISLLVADSTEHADLVEGKYTFRRLPTDNVFVYLLCKPTSFPIS